MVVRSEKRTNDILEQFYTLLNKPESVFFNGIGLLK